MKPRSSIAGSKKRILFLPSLFPIRELLRNFVYMGPVSWKSAYKSLDPTVVIEADQPLVYVTMGSSGNREHMKTIAERLRDSQYQVVITTGGVISDRTEGKTEDSHD